MSKLLTALLAAAFAAVTVSPVAVAADAKDEKKVEKKNVNQLPWLRLSLHMRRLLYIYLACIVVSAVAAAAIGFDPGHGGFVGQGAGRDAGSPIGLECP